MYQNVHVPVASLTKAPVKTGGLCAIKIFKWEDVLTWPTKNPLTGTITSTITLKPGKFIYLIEAIDSKRSFKEIGKSGGAGSFYEVSVEASLQGSNAASILSLETMALHQWGLIVEDRNGFTRLIGDRDSGADLIRDYDSGTLNNSRTSDIKFIWQCPSLSVPVYTGTSFDIVIGGQTITAGALQLIVRFEVGAPAAPMDEDDTTLTNASFVNKNLLVLADGTGLPVDDGSGAINWVGSIKRHVEKALGGNTITFVGGVVNKETIEVYAFSS